MPGWKTLKNADGKSGVRYREHKTRKHGAVPDRYYVISYWWQGKTVSEAVGWASENQTPGKCFELLAQIKENQSTGNGPCTLSELRAQAERKRAAETKELKSQDVTVGEAWAAYISERRDHWSDRHLVDHESIADPGGRKRQIGKGNIKSGPLASLMGMKLASLNPETIEEWLSRETKKRSARARLAYSLFRAFVRWCDAKKEYSGLCSPDICSTRIKKDILPRQKPKDDCLQREQLPAWFKAVREFHNPVISAYLQTLLLTGARREELAPLRWDDVDFKWQSLTIRDKVESERIIPLTPYVASLLSALPRRNEFVFSSHTSASQRISEPRHGHNKCLVKAGIEDLTIHGLRRSFGTLSEWVECPIGVVAQIMGHKPSAIAEKHYRRRPLDLLRLWHVKIEAWILEQAGIEQPNESADPAKLRVVK